eukprot:2359342-Rhodomonas_salina.2
MASLKTETDPVLSVSRSAFLSFLRQGVVADKSARILIRTHLSDVCWHLSASVRALSAVPDAACDVRCAVAAGHFQKEYAPDEQIEAEYKRRYAAGTLGT